MKIADWKPRPNPLASRLEEPLQIDVVDAFRKLGWRVIHVRAAMVKCPRCKGAACKKCKGRGYSYRTPVMGDGKGFPDVLAIGLGDPARMIAVELKSEDGTVEPEQSIWLDRFYAAGAETYVWRPRHWNNGEVQWILQHKPEIRERWKA